MLLIILLLCSWITHVSSLSSPKSGLTVKPFRNLTDVQHVICSAKPLLEDLSHRIGILTLTLSDNSTWKPVLGSINNKDKECHTSDKFVRCYIDEGNPVKTELHLLVQSQGSGECTGVVSQCPWIRELKCNVSWFTSVGAVHMTSCNVSWFTSVGAAHMTSWSIPVPPHTRTTTTVAPTTTTTTRAPYHPQPATENPVASGVKSNVQEFQLPISVVIIGLVLLLFFAILCAILVILQCRGKRRRRSRAANRESLLAAKNERMQEGGGYRTPRNVPNYPPGHMAQETPGGNLAMRYQKSIPDTGYVSGSSVYYSEPYGTLDEELKERLRPNPRMCHIPYDIKGGPLDTAGHPQEHSA